jgi:putative DNA primase/helicase
LTTKRSLLSAARAAAQAGFRVFPVRPRSKAPAIIGWQSKATKDKKVIDFFWADHPEANIGVATGGKLGLLVLDVDGDEGGQSLADLRQQHGRLPRTVKVLTPRGKHYYFRTDEPLRNSVGKLGPGLDVRTDGGYVVAAGSVNGDGVRYRYDTGSSPNDVDIAKIPDWLLERLREDPDKSKQSSNSSFQSGITTPYAAAALQDEAEDVRGAPEGTRNQRLNDAGFSMGQLIALGEISATEVETALTSAARAAGLEAGEIQRTLDSGLSAGQKQPRKRNDSRATKINDPLLSQLANLGETDTDNAQRLLRRYGNLLQFVPERKEWFAFDGQVWREDTAKQRVIFAQDSARLIASEVDLLDGDDQRADRRRWAQQSLGASPVKRAIEMAQPHATQSIAKFDRDPWLFNLKNGTLDLRTESLRPHASADHLTRLAGTSYDSDAECPRFKRFVSEIFDRDRQLIGFLQRFTGYTLTGSNREQCFLFCQGRGQNGKSSLIGILQELLGDYARTTPTQTLLAKFFTSTISNDLARLAGARMVSAIESNPNTQLDEALIKQMTGGDRITARFLYAENFEYTPEFKLWFVANHPPRLRSTDDALWRRIHVLPFEVAIPKEQVDGNLLVELRTELPGILNWAVRGCRRWQRDGLQVPERVLAATKLYRKEVDHARKFRQECVESDDNAVTPSKILYDRYERWCSKNGERQVSKVALAKRLSEAGFVHTRLPGSGARAWRGVKLRD